MTNGTSDRKRVGLWPGRFDLLLVAAILATWVALFPRLVPDLSHDQSIFISVAARLLAGDRLYVDVYDNKEPLFYYLATGELALGRWSQVATQALLVAAAAFSAYLIATKLASRWTALAVSFIAVPIVLTGEFYVPGYSELPGIALTLAAVAASACRRPMLAGMFIGILTFTKLIDVPVALVGVGCFCRADRRIRDLLTIVLGALAAAALVVIVLFVRGELAPFVQTIKLNIAYSQGNLIGPEKGPISLVTHLKRLGGWTLLGQIVPTLLAAVVALIALSWRPAENRNRMAICAAGVATLAGSLAVLSVTGLWPQHRQLVYIPTILVLLSLTPILDVAAAVGRLRTLAAILLIGLAMAGTQALSAYVDAIHSFRRSYAELNAQSPEARRLLAIGSAGAYARFGQYDDRGGAVGLGNWKLACPRFHQYPFETADVLAKVFACASTAPVLIVAESLTPQSDWPAWNAFVADVEHLVQDYSCDADSGLRICTRRSNR